MTNKINMGELNCLYKKINPSRKSLTLIIFISDVLRIKYRVDRERTKIGKLSIGMLCWLGVKAKKYANITNMPPT